MTILRVVPPSDPCLRALWLCCARSFRREYLLDRPCMVMLPNDHFRLFIISRSFEGVRAERAALSRRKSAAVIILCVIGAFGLQNSMDDLFVMFVFGIIGHVMRKFDIPVAPAILALVLGDMAELALRRSLLLSLGDTLILVSGPISLILLAGAAFSIIDPLLKKPKMLQGL